MTVDIKTKQQEIRELLEMLLRVAPVPLDDVENVAQTILDVFASQGVVLKVVPNEKWCPQHGYPTPCDKCGTVTERLIE